MPMYTYGGSPADVLTNTSGDVIPDYPVLVRRAGTGEQVTALLEIDGVTPIGQLRTNPATSDQPGAIRPFKIEGVSAIEYEYNGASGPVRWYEAGREVATTALERALAALPRSGGTVTGTLTVEGTLTVDGAPVGGLERSAVYDVRQLGALGDGVTDDAPAIQSALTAARDNGGGTVLVPPGTYRLATLPLRIYRNTHLRCMPGARLVRAAAVTMLLNGDAEQNYGGYSGHGNLVIEGGTWDMAGTSVTASNMCISLGHASDITVRGVTVLDVPGYHGIEINAVQRARILNCTFLGYIDPGSRDFSEAIQLDLAKGSAYFGGFGPYDDTPCRDVLIDGCTVGASGTPGTTAWPRGIGSHSASPGRPHHDIRIIGCRFEGLSQWAVGAYTWQGLNISNLQLRNCGGGVWVRTLDSSKASHRTPAGGSSPTITGSQPLAGIVIEGVTMTGGGTYGAAVELAGEATGYVQDATVGQITARGVGAQAVRLEHVEDYTVADVIAHTTAATAISTLGTRRGQITDCQVNGSGGAGVTVDSRTTPAETGTSVTVSRCQVTGTAANGVHVWSGRDVTIADCDVYDLTGYGVQVSTGTDRLTVRGTTARGTTLAGINITNTVTNVRRWGNSAAVADASTTQTLPSPFDSGQGAVEESMRPAGRWETTSRMRCGATSTAPVSGTLYLVPIWLPAGAVLSNISFVNGATAAASPTNWWFSLHDSGRKMLARTADQGTAAWASNTVKTLPIAQTTAGNAASYTTTYEGLHYLGIMIKATTLPNLVGEGSMATGAGATPGWGDTNTGMSTPPTVSGSGFTAAPFGGNVGLLAYGYVS
ncbi:right-handed parallel beta-helix repeat-containing protein [Streptomyces albus]